MKTRDTVIFVLAMFLSLSQTIAQTKSNTINFDEGWRFHLGAMLGAEKKQLNDSQWRTVDLPHDWSIEDKAGTKNPFDPTAVGQVSTGFTPQGTAWYRKTFEVAKADEGKQVIIQFDGVYMNADVYVNGKLLGKHPYGYTSFYYNITKELEFGSENTIAVEVKNEGANSRWYSGSGIYRHVWLKTVPPVHIVQWGTFVTTPTVSESSATVNIKTALENTAKTDTEVKVLTSLIAPDGSKTKFSENNVVVKAGENKTISHSAIVKKPKLWTLEQPTLYVAVTDVYLNGELINTEENKFGIRTISFDVKTGFQLNGKTLKLKGGCIHHDNGPLGAKSYDRAEERKVEVLKQNGYNAIRFAHNPPSPAFLDACDKLGMLVIVEAFDMWNVAKNPYDYHLFFKDWWKKDLKSMITRDQNHPSVIMWSIGNEIPERGDSLGVKTAKELAAYVKTLDTTRPVTAGVNGLAPDKDPYFATLDVAGYNYGVGGDHLKKDVFAEDNQRVPNRIMYSSESYPLEAFGSWMAVEDKPFLIGDFVWTAWDYIGESGLGWVGYPQSFEFYPWNLAFTGDLDLCGFKRPQSYYRDALWKKNQLSIFVTPPFASFKSNPDLASWSKWNWHDVLPDWNWEGYENKPLEVSVYSSCDKIELFLNGKSLGVKTTDRTNEFTASFKIPYQPGVLKAVGYVNNKIMNTQILQTSGMPAMIKLTADRSLIKANNQDLSYITLDLQDAAGVLHPKADNLIQFSISGDAKIVGVGNGNPVSLESFQLPQRQAWKGKCLVIVKAGKTSEKVILTATSPGLESKSVEINIVN